MYFLSIFIVEAADSVFVWRARVRRERIGRGTTNRRDQEHGQMKVLVRQAKEKGDVRVIERRHDGSRLYYEGGALYTHVDADGNNILEYITAMERSLAGAQNVLLLGTAGGALATLLSRRGVSVTAVDNWPMAFDIARRWFHLPPAVECIAADALDFLRSTSRQWDAVAIDVFHGVEIPESILTSDIGALLAKTATPGGLIVWNVADGPRSWPAQWIVKVLRLKSLVPRLIAVMDCDVGNTLVVCRNSPRRGALTGAG